MHKSSNPEGRQNPCWQKQSVTFVEPTSDVERAGHLRQAEAPAVAYSPSPHTMHAEAFDARAAKPAGQDVQLVDPEDDAYIPGMHRRHCVASACSAYLPGGHGVGGAAPPAQNAPAVHSCPEAAEPGGTVTHWADPFDGVN